MNASRSKTTSSVAALAVLVCVVGAGVKPAAAQDNFLGEIRTFGFNFCPVGWVPTNGQLLSIAQNTALFSLLGTQFGGNGQTTFALPDLRGRVVIGVGQGPGLTPYVVGQQGGEETTTLNISQIPAHSHSYSGVGPVAVAVDGCNNAKGAAKNCVQALTAETAANTGSTGGGESYENRQPYLAMTTCIAVQGIFPSRE